MSDYLPVADHGLIGALHSAAQVGSDGTIAWYCCPRFDSPSVFGSILDADRSGRYRISPAGEVSSTRQLYVPDTNVLITGFLTADGVGEVEGFMPSGTSAAERRQRVVRRIVVVRGTMQFALRYGIDGRSKVPEELLDHLVGYRGSAPVRIGNNAASQLQLDIYDELIDSVYLYNKHGTPIYHDAGKTLPDLGNGFASSGTKPTRASGRPAAGGARALTHACCAG